MPESNGNNRRDFSKFDNMSTEKLEDILRADSQLSDGLNSDTDAILYIMEVIAKREKENPTGKFTDVHTAWASFNENYLTYIEDDKSLYDFEDTKEESGISQAFSPRPSRPLRKRRLMRVALVSAIVAALLLAGTITASAFGVDLWGAVAKWTKDTFGFANYVTTQPSTNPQYEGLQDALANYDVSAPIAPTWFPEGYLLENISINETPAQIVINARYSNMNSVISVNVTLHTSPTSRTYEKDETNVTVFSVNEIEHYVMSNMNQTNIVWKTDNYECSISGPFTLDEAERMLTSIYERN